MSHQTYRIKRDPLGGKPAPVDASRGVQSLRAAEHFPITGSPMAISPDSINAQVATKPAAAPTHRQMGLLDAALTRAIVWICEG